MRYRLRTLMSWLMPQNSRDFVRALNDRLTDRARMAIKIAEQEARRLNHEYLGTDHLLLGLVNDNGIAAAMMQQITGDLVRIGAELNKVMMPGPESVAHGALMLTPRLRKAIDYAVEEARALNHRYIGSEHLLLGLLRDPEGLPAAVLSALAVDVATLRREVLSLMGNHKNG